MSTLARTPTPMEGHHDAGDGDSARVLPTKQCPAPNATEDAPSQASSPKSPALSVTAAVLAAGSLIRGSGTTPAADHFVPLPGGDDEAEDVARYPAFKPFKPKKPGGGPTTKHGILEEPATLGGGGSRWGVEELLGSTAAGRGSSKGFAANAKSTIVSGLGKLTAVAAKSVATAGGGGDDGMEEQPCEYVAMSTPCESPVMMVSAGAMRAALISLSEQGGSYRRELR